MDGDRLLTPEGIQSTSTNIPAVNNLLTEVNNNYPRFNNFREGMHRPKSHPEEDNKVIISQGLSLRMPLKQSTSFLATPKCSPSPAPYGCWIQRASVR